MESSTLETSICTMGLTTKGIWGSMSAFHIGASLLQSSRNWNNRRPSMLRRPDDLGSREEGVRASQIFWMRWTTTSIHVSASARRGRIDLAQKSPRQGVVEPESSGYHLNSLFFSLFTVLFSYRQFLLPGPIFHLFMLYQYLLPKFLL